MKKLTIDEFIKRAQSVHGTKYDYSEVEYKNSAEHVKIKCSIHGIFLQKPSNHLNGSGCQQCGIIQNKYNPKKITNEKYIKRCENIRGTENFDYGDVQYDGIYSLVKIICKKHGPFFIGAKYFLDGGKCPQCKYKTSNRRSFPEKILLERYSNIFKQSVWHVLKNKELDLYSEKHKLAIEVNGVYWHSIDFKDKDYHLNKTDRCEKMGIRLLHFTDKEILENFEWVCDVINSYLENNYCHLTNMFEFPYNRKYISTLIFDKYEVSCPTIENNMWNCGYIVNAQ